MVPDEGEIELDGQVVYFRRPQDARAAGIETVYQTLAVAPALDIAANMFLGRERRRPGPLGTWFRMMDKPGMRRAAQRGRAGARHRHHPEHGPDRRDPVGRPAPGGGRGPGGRVRQPKVIILDEPTAALGVKESGQVLQLIRDLRDRGLPVILISHNMPHVFEVADRIHIQRLGRRAAVITPEDPHHARGGGHHDRRRPRRRGLAPRPSLAGRGLHSSPRPGSPPLRRPGPGAPGPAILAALAPPRRPDISRRSSNCGRDCFAQRSSRDAVRSASAVRAAERAAAPRDPRRFPAGNRWARTPRWISPPTTAPASCATRPT